MESVDNPALPQSGSVKTTNEEQVEYANGRPSRYLPGVTIVGQPAIEIRRAKRVRPLLEFPSRGQAVWAQAQPAAPPPWQSAPAGAMNTHYEDEWPLTFSVPQGKEVPSLYQTPVAKDTQSQGGSLLAQIANQICNGT